MKPNSTSSETRSFSPFERCTRKSTTVPTHGTLNEDLTSFNIQTFKFYRQRNSSYTSKDHDLSILPAIDHREIIHKVYGKASMSPRRLKHTIPKPRVKVLKIDKPLFNYNQNLANESPNSRMSSSSNQRFSQQSRQTALRLRDKILQPIARQSLSSKLPETRINTAIHSSGEIFL